MPDTLTTNSPIIATYLIQANDKQPWYLIAYVVFAALVSMFSAIAIRRRQLPAITTPAMTPVATR